MKVSELTGAMLDYWAGKASGLEVLITPHGCLQEMEVGPNPGRNFCKFNPSTDWAQGGSIIERYLISVEGTFNGWGTTYWIAKVTPSGFEKQGPKPLIAAMRTYVASKFGDEVPYEAEVAR